MTRLEFFSNQGEGEQTQSVSELCCPIPELENGEIISKSTGSVNSCAYFYRDTVHYMCYKKYHFEARCREDGTWYPKTPTCDEHCDFPPEVAHGRYEEIIGFRVFIQNEVIYKCDEGYALVGVAKLSCSSSHWTPAAPQCKALCPKPEIAHAKLSVNKDQYLQAANVTIQCDSGYELDGPQSITCLEDRTWYPGVPKCEWVVPESCEYVGKGRKIMQCLPNPADVKMALELYKYSLEIEVLERQIEKEMLTGCWLARLHHAEEDNAPGDVRVTNREGTLSPEDLIGLSS
ncbi:hypothetical protein PANDA_018753 [Ailuropoda melanoleuca]|uniref:Sushi domain-containing protein n=1 Tax=Ailuropoda melanoleuca TaxID=9646 RepID=D2I0L9_AILME|nr:hypothetical protein PANDA_018753 [Ailuropoda melanoleuca]